MARTIHGVLIGAGSSVFGPPTLLDLLTCVFGQGGRLSLVDTDAAALSLMEGAARKLSDSFGGKVAIAAATAREEVLAEADFVIISVEEDRIGRWKLDWEIPQRFGIKHTLGENRGPAGLSHTLRTAPLVLGICRDIERLAPAATVIIMTNPEDRLAYAVNKYTRLRVFGYCDGLWDFKQNFVGKLLGIPGEKIHLHAAGINHAVWITDLRNRETGEDLYPLMLSKGRQTGWQPFGQHLYRTYGLWPHENDEHYGEYFHYACEFMECKGYDFDEHVAMDRGWKQRIGEFVAGRYDPERFTQETRDFMWRIFGDVPPSNIIGGVHLGRPAYLQNANIPNRGALPGLPDDMIVELPAVATPSGIFGVHFQKLPDPIIAFLYREGVIQGLAAEAAVEGSRHKALQALMLDPQVRSAEMAAALLDAFLEAHEGFIPESIHRGLRAEGKVE
jgi:alpha-galactosidase